MMPRSSFRAPLLAVLIAACASDTAQPQGVEPSASTGDESTASADAPDRAHHMQATFWMAVQARDSVIAGDLAMAKTAARSLEQHDYGDAMPASWKPWIGDMQKQAGEVVLAADIDGAAQAIGALGLTCGNCHYHHSAGPDAMRKPPVPWDDETDSMTERMDRHYVGVDQLWLGLVDPSEQAWRAGTITLTRAPLAAPQTKDGTLDPKAAAEVESVRALAKRARTAGSHAERAQIYGELIAGCGNCHTTTTPNNR